MRRKGKGKCKLLNLLFSRKQKLPLKKRGSQNVTRKSGRERDFT